MIETIEGGIRSSSWHFFPPQPPNDPNPPENPPPCNKCPGPATAGGTSEIVLQTGEYLEDHDLVTYQSQGVQRGVSLVYRSLRADPRPIIQFGFENVIGNRLYASLTLDANGVEIPLSGDTTFGLGAAGAHAWTADGDAHGALQLDLRSLPSGQYDYALRYGTGAFSLQPDSDNSALMAAR